VGSPFRVSICARKRRTVEEKNKTKTRKPKDPNEKTCPKCKHPMYRDKNHVCRYPCECYAAYVPSPGELCPRCRAQKTRGTVTIDDL